MKQVDFDRIRGLLRGRLIDRPDYEAILDEVPGVSYDTLASIFSQDCVSRIKHAYGIHRRHDRLRDYTAQWHTGKSIVGIGESLDFPFCCLARLMLPCILGSDAQAKVAKFLKDPESLLDAEERETWGDRLGDVDAHRLVSELSECVAKDEVSSPLVANVKRAIGLEYEFILYEMLHSAGIAFETEDELRRKGATKTPDVLLKIPIMYNKRLIHWIDSKACFCSEDLYYNDGVKQFRQYVNRFGPGMAIYWFGYVEDLLFEDEVTICDAFPNECEITRL